MREPGTRNRAFPAVINEILTMAPLLQHDFLVGIFLFAVTAILISLWIPGFIMPIAASSGALLDSWWGAAPVVVGSLVGSLVIFHTTRRFGRDRIPERVATFMSKFEEQALSTGAWYVFMLRLIGTPHFLVSAGSALTPIKVRSFAIATVMGTLPAILMAAALGSSLA
jgi:uncharacterized membrane protein YdjX (TVP38/TMEM64 family)